MGVWEGSVLFRQAEVTVMNSVCMSLALACPTDPLPYPPACSAVWAWCGCDENGLSIKKNASWGHPEGLPVTVEKGHLLE